MFFICSTGFDINYEYRKWNYPIRKRNYFSHFQVSDQKTSFTKCFSYDLRGSKLIFKTGNGIFQTGNGIISPTSRPLIKKLLLQNLSCVFQGVQNPFSKQGMELYKQEMEYIQHLEASYQKTYMSKSFSFNPRGSKSI